MKGLYDIHCHILPEVDDGAKSMREACWMVRKEHAEGVRNIIVTPHFRYEMFEPPMEKVKLQFERLQREVEKLEIDMKLYLGCELHSSSDMVSRLKAGERLTMAGSRYVLVEFGNSEEKASIRERTQQLIRSGYIPIIAHAERYRVLRKEIPFISELREMGACIQVNSGSITGKEGFSVRSFCRKLMREEIFDFVGTDGHGSSGRVPELAQCFQQVMRIMGAQNAERIFIENPKKITG